MSRYTLFAVIAALCLTIASADLSNANFNQPPGKVFDGSTGAADVLTWGTYSEAHFGPGTENTTLYAYGLLVTGGTTLTTVASRKLNATILANGTAATAVTDAKVGDDAVASPGTAITSYKVAVGNGSIGIAYATGSSTVCPQVTVVIYNGGSNTAAATKAVTTNTCSKCTDATAASTGVGYGVVVTSLFYENSTYYVSWTSTKYTETSAGSGTDCSANFPTAIGTIVKAQVYSYLQGVTTAGELKWTTSAVTIYTGTETAANTAPVPLASTIVPTCGPQNYTASTNFYCVYADALTNANLKAVKVLVADGTADSGTTIATSTSGSAPAADTTYNTYTLAGFVYGLNQQGILINNAGAKFIAGASAASSWTNALHLYNLTSGASSTTGATAGGIAITGISNAPTAAGTTFAGAGITYGSGYAILSRSATTSAGVTTTTYEMSPFFANSTLNGTKVTVAAQTGLGNYFADNNGALWFGGYQTTSSLVTTGQVGKLVAYLYNAGNILASFFALISLMIAALFAF